MRRLLRKINRGVLLLLLLFLGVSIYLMISDAAQKREISEIKNVCQEYLDAKTGWFILPEKYRSGKSDQSAAYLSVLAQPIRSYLVDDDAVVQSELDGLKSVLDSQKTYSFYYSDYRLQITYFENIIFDGNRAIVRLEGQKTVTGAYLGSENAPEIKYDSIFTDIILCKVNGKWKVYYGDSSFGNLYMNDDGSLFSIGEGGVNYVYG